MLAPDLKPTIRAAGGVLRRSEPRTEYLVVHRPKYDDWSLPKGKLDTGESYLGAAHREVLEETGYHATEAVPVGSIGYDTVAGSRKLVRWWSMTAGLGAFQPNAEVDGVEWLPAAEAYERLTYRNDRSVLDRARELALDPTEATVHLIRNSAGRAHAVALALGLRHFPLTRIVSGASPQCRETVIPLAESLEISPEVDSRLNVDAAVDDVLTLFGDLSGEAVAAASHEEAIGALLQAVAEDGLELSGPLEWPMGSVWTLQLRKGEVVSAVYSPPPVRS